MFLSTKRYDANTISEFKFLRIHSNNSGISFLNSSNVLNPESHKDPGFKSAYDKIGSPLASKEKGERYVYLDTKPDEKTKSDVTRIDNEIEKNTALQGILNRINTQEELSNLILALFIFRDNKGESLFSPDKSFGTDAGKVRSALFGLNSRIPDKIEETENKLELPSDVKKFYELINNFSSVKSKILSIDTLPEFYQFIIRSILPKINSNLRSKPNQIKEAIAKAANASTKYKDLLEPQKEK